MSRTTIYQPKYENSWALLVGINQYNTAAHLAYARQDAEAFAEVLTRLDFPASNITVLLDADASHRRIMSGVPPIRRG